VSDGIISSPRKIGHARLGGIDGVVMLSGPAAGEFSANATPDHDCRSVIVD
jgi:hypothetical protein